MMIDPPIGELLKKVDCRYTLAVEASKRARELGLYMQKYCGCVFSEEERYLKAKKILR